MYSHISSLLHVSVLQGVIFREYSVSLLSTFLVILRNRSQIYASQTSHFSEYQINE
jgi:hypothetical protein